MSTRGIRLAGWAVAVLLTRQLSAQTVNSVAPSPYRAWDAIGGVGLRFGNQEDAVVPGGDWDVEVGRYWTAHLKTSIGLSTAGQEIYSTSTAPQAWITTTAKTGAAGLSVSVTYQFLENAFAHPYVVGGLRFASVSDSIQTRSNMSPYQILSLMTTAAQVQARPIMGGGFKSYFDNGRAFMRSELLLAVSPDGSGHAVLHVGAGVDF